MVYVYSERTQRKQNVIFIKKQLFDLANPVRAVLARSLARSLAEMVNNLAEQRKGHLEKKERGWTV
jgi:hypothetical protein